VRPALPDSRAFQEVQASLAGLDVPDQQVIRDLLAIQVVPVSLDLEAQPVRPASQVSATVTRE